MRGEKLINLLKATRFRRCLPSLMAALIVPAYMSQFSPHIFTLLITTASFYSLTSIHNAYKDNDYPLPKSFPIILAIGLLVTLALATTSKPILIISLIAIPLGYIYNTASRYVPLGDSLVAGITHYVLPVAAATMILETKPLIITPLFAFFMFSLMPISNLKDIQKDRDLGYKTLVGRVQNPLWTGTIFSSIAFMLTIILFYSLSIPTIFLAPIFATQLFIILSIHHNRLLALEMTRLHIIVILATIIFALTTLPTIILTTTAILATYLFLFIIKAGELYYA